VIGVNPNSVELTVNVFLETIHDSLAVDDIFALGRGECRCCLVSSYWRRCRAGPSWPNFKATEVNCNAR
jgi:hypothetical protein